MFGKVLRAGVLVVCIAVSLVAVDEGTVGTDVDSLSGVPVKYNGWLLFRGRGRSVVSDGTDLGQKWQCVEFVRRFYHDAYNFEFPDGRGHAKSWFDERVAQGELNARRGLLQFRNGGNVAPSPGDVLVFTDSHYGHVAVVGTVAEGRVEFIQQNVPWATRGILHIETRDGRVWLRGARQPAAWLRRP